MDDALHKKLRLDKFNRIAIVKNAKESKTIFAEYTDKNINTNEELIGLDLGIAFVYSLNEMKEQIFELYNKSRIEEGGLLYLVYPKNGNKLGHSPILRDSIFPFLEVNDEDGYVHNTSYKFNLMLSLDDNYTIVAVKNLKRPKEAISSHNVQRSSAKVDDYVDKIAYIEVFLKQYPEILQFYINLTPGYRKDWARYVYSAKKSETVNKRLNEMLDSFSQGYNSIQFYKNRNK